MTRYTRVKNFRAVMLRATFSSGSQILLRRHMRKPPSCPRVVKLPMYVIIVASIQRGQEGPRCFILTFRCGACVPLYDTRITHTNRQARSFEEEWMGKMSNQLNALSVAEGVLTSHGMFCGVVRDSSIL